ncbi:hypothetical protein EUX98_g5157 [Antrodiella citrinella]|uniref:Uncharacterized protein n=1 Tax=Antrodiella citrinella TaxID=2447956 RepID=A0A4S4MSA1_9APHY|nr:hypothetical protein EUX98_g5157 [Antrodiella citrinella]
MIIDKLPLPEDPTPTEAPPSYDTVESNPPRTSTYPTDAKSSNPYAPPPISPASPSSPGQSLQGKGSIARSSSSWFAFGHTARTAKEIRNTVLGVVRDVVQNTDSDVSSSLSILESCSAACRARDIPFGTILQEKSVEGHSPLYWAIVKRPAAENAPHGPDLLSNLMEMAAPLTQATISEIRLACLDTSDQTLFQQLRRSPAFAPLEGTDQILLGASVPPDDVDVEDIPGDEGAFTVSFRIVAFQKRMRVTKHIDLEFIARSRIWRLRFLIVENARSLNGKSYVKGKWLVVLSLLEHSPPTWIDSRLLIADPQTLLQQECSETTTSNPLCRKPSSKLKPTIELRIKTHTVQLQSAGSIDVGASLDDSLMGNSLQYEGSSYIHSDGSLHAKLEAKLVRNDSPDCIIC